MHLAARGGGSGQGIHQRRLDAAIENPALGGFGHKRREARRGGILECHLRLHHVTARASRSRAQILNDDCADDVAIADQETFTQAARLLKLCLWLNAER